MVYVSASRWLLSYGHMQLDNMQKQLTEIELLICKIIFTKYGSKKILLISQNDQDAGAIKIAGWKDVNRIYLAQARASEHGDALLGSINSR